MLFEITAVNDYDQDEADASLMMMIGHLQSGVPGASLMYLEGMMNGADILVLVDLGSTHNVIGLHEQCIDTTILVGSGNAVTCRNASFNVPLRMGSDAFDIDVFLLNIGNNINIVLGTPWLVSLSHVTWDFNDMEMTYFHDGRPHTFRATHRR
jgi:hypothetical protein